MQKKQLTSRIYTYANINLTFVYCVWEKRFGIFCICFSLRLAWPYMHMHLFF